MLLGGAFGLNEAIYFAEQLKATPTIEASPSVILTDKPIPTSTAVVKGIDSGFMITFVAGIFLLVLLYQIVRSFLKGRLNK